MIQGTILIFVIIAIIVISMSIIGWYRVVTPDEAHLVVGPKMKKIFTSNQSMVDNDNTIKKWYFAIPLIRSVRIIDFKPRELKEKMITREKAMGRFFVQYSLKYKINNVEKAIESFVDYPSLEEMLQEVVQNAVRVVTVRKTIEDCISKKSEIANEVGEEIADDLNQWGLCLVTFQLTDFEDTEESDIVSKLSEGREAEVRSKTAQIVADRDMQARVKVAESEELAKNREIEKDEKIGVRNQEMAEKISLQEKIAKESEYEVKKVEAVKQADINKETALVVANQNKEVQAIKSEERKLEGEGEKDYLMEKAIGEASKIRENGNAEAEAKEKLKKALEFSDNAIRTLVAEKIVEAQRDIGVEGAKALANAEFKVFSGSDGGGGFDIGKAIESTNVSSNGTAKAMLKRLGIPNNLGFDGLDLSSLDKKFKGNYVSEPTDMKEDVSKEDKNLNQSSKKESPEKSDINDISEVKNKSNKKRFKNNR